MKVVVKVTLKFNGVFSLTMNTWIVNQIANVCDVMVKSDARFSSATATLVG